MLRRNPGPSARLSLKFPTQEFASVIGFCSSFFIRRGSSLIAVLMVGLALHTASALDPSRTIQQFDHTSWTARQGAPTGTAALAQTTDGYLWLATPSGLVRFDGVTFEAFRPLKGPALPQSDVSALTATDDGGLWIGYRLGGCSFLKNGMLTNYSFPEGRTVWAFKFAKDGTLWMGGGFVGGLARFKGGGWDAIGGRLGYTGENAYWIFFDHRGDLWVQETTTEKIWVLRVGADRFLDTGILANEGGPFVESDDGTLWWLVKNGIAHLSIQQPGTLKPVGHPILVKSPSMLLVDQDGGLWAFAREGILRIPSPAQLLREPESSRSKLKQYLPAQGGLNTGYVVAALNDREGNIWVASNGSLDRFRTTTLRPSLLGRHAIFNFAISAKRDGKVFVGTLNDGLLSVSNSDDTPATETRTLDINCLYPSPDGKLWIGGLGKLGYFKNHQYVRVPLPPNIIHDIQSLSYGVDGSLWLSSIRRPPYVLKEGIWTELTPPKGFPKTVVRFFLDREGRMWAAYMGGKIAVYDGKTVQTYSETDGLSIGNVMTIYETKGNVWVAGQYGVNLFRAGHFVPMHFQDNVELAGVTGVVEGDDQSLWMNTVSGIFSVSGEEVQAFLKSPEHYVSFTKFDILDGVNGNAPQLRPLPTAIKATDGRLWFALDGDIVSVDPLHVFRGKVIPPVSILRIRSGSGRQQEGDFISLLKAERDIEIDYSAASLSIPERVNFKYRLDDGEWQNAGTRRQAFFTDLAPGRHRFQVLASNGYGVWNETGASISLFRPPTFTESIWFKLLWITVVGLATWVIFVLRMRQVTLRVQSRMSERLVERERIARDLHDTLLQGFQGVLLRFQTISKRLSDNTKARQEMDDTITRADQVLSGARDKVWQLRASSVPSQDLASWISKAAGHLIGEGSADFSLHIVGTPRILIADAFEEICAITQEALANAFRHSEGHSIQVELQFGQSEFRARILDDGKGLPPGSWERAEDTKHWGLLGMQERAKKLGAKFILRERQKGGTEVLLTVPGSICYRPTPGGLDSPLQRRCTLNLGATIRLMAVDDHPITLDGIAYALQEERDIEVIAQGGSGGEAVRLYSHHRPDVTLIDLRLPDMSGIAAMEEILKSFPDGKFIVLTTYHGDVPARKAYRAGALGYLFKGMLSRDLAHSIRRVCAGERVMPPEVAESIEQYASAVDLTDRETAVLRLVAAGNSNKVVAAHLNLSAETVKGHMKVILGKLGAGDRTHAVTIAQQRGFLDD